MTLLYAEERPEHSGVCGLYLDDDPGAPGPELEVQNPRVYHVVRGSRKAERVTAPGSGPALEVLEALRSRLYLWENGRGTAPERITCLHKEGTPPEGIYFVQGSFTRRGLGPDRPVGAWMGLLRDVSAKRLRRHLGLDVSQLERFAELPAGDRTQVPDRSDFWRLLGGPEAFKKGTRRVRDGKLFEEEGAMGLILRGSAVVVSVPDWRVDFRGQAWLLLLVDRDSAKEWVCFDALLALGLGFLARCRANEPARNPESVPASDKWFAAMREGIRPRNLFSRKESRSALEPAHGRGCAMRGFGCRQMAQHVDHIVPRGHWGGPDEPWNLQPLCATCHELKTDSDKSWCVMRGPVSLEAAAGVVLLLSHLRDNAGDADATRVPLYAKPIGARSGAELAFPTRNAPDEDWMAFWRNSFHLHFQDCRGPGESVSLAEIITRNAQTQWCGLGAAREASGEANRDAERRPLFNSRGTACVHKQFLHCPKI